MPAIIAESSKERGLKMPKGCGCAIVILIIFIMMGSSQGGLGGAILMGLFAAGAVFGAMNGMFN